MLFGIVRQLRAAYTLFEFVAYTALFSFIAVVFLGVISGTQFKLLKFSCEREALLRQVLAIDLLRRDLVSAGILSSDWEAQGGIFKKIILTKKNQQEDVCVRWFIREGNLIRAQGKYNFEKHEWDKKTECLVCKAINQINFALEQSKESFLGGVWVTYKSFDRPDRMEKIYVKFRNRVLI